MSTPRLTVSGLAKTYGNSPVLQDAAFEVVAGEIHALVGQNGSGKSTLVKILTGYHGADPGGAVHVDGHRLTLPARPADLRRLGVSVVHQDLGLNAGDSVVDNICVGSWPRHPLTRLIDRRRAARQARDALERIGEDVALDALVGDLPIADQVSVAIARGVRNLPAGGGLAVFDESTRALPPDSLGHFHALTRALAAQGTGVLLVSHNLDEVLDLADRVTVLRGGRVVEAGLPTGGLDAAGLTRLILGHTLDAAAATARPAPEGADEVFLRQAGGGTLTDLSVRLAAGEIVGVTGLTGAGHEDLPALLTGARSARAGGELRIGDTTLDLAGLTPRRALAAGVHVVPADRGRHGLALELSIEDNIALARLRRGRLRPLTRRAHRTDAATVIEELGVRPPLPDALIRTLSGGNQQKVLIGRALLGSPRLLVLHEPTQAVDVGARRDIHTAIRRHASSGTPVLVIASDPAELVELCDRIVLVHDGRGRELTGGRTVEAVLDGIYQPATPQGAIHHGN
ncbi:ATP-binding cassette domain-containing protein [Actinomadura sp. LD22]|uniref:ATP-binding cassette domain-containing protein n=1 Tax=Actinomadura physcomitrii TaxID=2650748 RepID=A0A6I4MHZ5_9ACTN|nr:sugar ABC transporter ATP-binding protein [Actinomadura physcomitrii]MWA05402.1 ATP-binding cassette domain-containing protein [Actinomadura physcomitrii]